MIYHGALPEDWATARATGEYRYSTRGLGLDEVGFIHAAFADQLLGVARRFYADLDHLVILVIDPTGLDLVVEPPTDGADIEFPHIYQPLPLDAVVATIDWHLVGEIWEDPDLTSGSSPGHP